MANCRDVNFGGLSDSCYAFVPFVAISRLPVSSDETTHVNAWRAVRRREMWVLHVNLRVNSSNHRRDRKWMYIQRTSQSNPHLERLLRPLADDYDRPVHRAHT
jgi:hypothetical protein